MRVIQYEEIHLFNCSPFLQAQDQDVDTAWLSVKANKTEVNPAYYGFIDNPVTFLILYVSADNPVKINVGSPLEDINLKVYSDATAGKKIPLTSAPSFGII